ncbi:hypothetical protein AUJ17_01045 [Candidatus Micrarchaeota archaeon CG1_02_47_40]|nr:MAG: hypothetical protein AUJ17_01045 [Candidatus Micrarchaeota archaeon CG1_02_47_40]
MLKTHPQPKKAEIPASNGLGTKYASKAFLEKMTLPDKANAIRELRERIDGIEKRIMLLKQNPGANQKSLVVSMSMRDACERDLAIVQDTKPIKITDEGGFNETDIRPNDFKNWRQMNGKRR